MSAAESVVSLIQHYQKSIQKSLGSSSRILHCINKLYSLPVTVQHLQDTGVGKTINSLRKSDGDVGEAARALVYKWKQMVEEESENEQESNKKVQPSSSYNDDSENENQRERSDKRNRENVEKSSRGNDHKEHSKAEHTKNQKRKRESEHDHSREKRHKSQKLDGLSNHNSICNSNASKGFNGSNQDFGFDEEWNLDRANNSGIISDDENDFRNGYIKNERISSDDDARQEKTNKKEKSHKHRSKTSSSSSEKSKPSSSRSECRESKSSSSTRHKEDKSSSSGNSSSTIKDDINLSQKSGDRSKSKDKERKDKQKEKHKSKDDRKSKDKKEKEKKNLEMGQEEEDGVDSFSGIGFGEALGMMFPPEKSKKKLSSGTSSSLSPSKKKLKPSSGVSDRKTQSRDSPYSPLEMEQEPSSSRLPPSLDVDEDFGLPALNPNYKPLPQPNLYSSPPKRYQSEDDDLSNIMYSKVQRTKVFSGNKTGYSYVPSLFDLCTRVLQENIDALEYTGGVPFDLLKPVLERATADQLFTLEHYNAYLIEDTDTFWEYHCKKDFRNKKREEMETWREMYLRCQEERERKLRSLTANIAASSKAKLLPVRKTQLAYIEGTVKPPRNIARKQAKFGTAHASSSSSSSSSKQDGPGLSSSFTGRSNTALSSGPAVSVPTPRGAAGSSHSSSCKPKPKAPLMQKALQLIKHNRFKR